MLPWCAWKNCRRKWLFIQYVHRGPYGSFYHSYPICPNSSSASLIRYHAIPMPNWKALSWSAVDKPVFYSILMNTAHLFHTVPSVSQTGSNRAWTQQRTVVWVPTLEISVINIFHSYSQRSASENNLMPHRPINKLSPGTKCRGIGKDVQKWKESFLCEGNQIWFVSKQM